MCMNIFPVCICVHYMCAWHPWRSEEDIDALELELKTAVSYHLVLGNEPGSSVGATSALNV